MKRVNRPDGGHERPDGPRCQRRPSSSIPGGDRQPKARRAPAGSPGCVGVREGPGGKGPAPDIWGNPSVRIRRLALRGAFSLCRPRAPCSTAACVPGCGSGSRSVSMAGRDKSGPSQRQIGGAAAMSAIPRRAGILLHCDKCEVMGQFQTLEAPFRCAGDCVTFNHRLPAGRAEVPVHYEQRGLRRARISRFQSKSQP
jgi:hypothetical protein